MQALKEKAELQAQLAHLDTRLRAHVEQSHSSQQKQDSLSSEVDTLKQSCWDLERAMTDLQNMLEAKNASLASSHSDLQVAEEQYRRLLAKVEDMQTSMLRKDNTGAWPWGSRGAGGVPMCQRAGRATFLKWVIALVQPWDCVHLCTCAGEVLGLGCGLSMGSTHCSHSALRGHYREGYSCDSTAVLLLGKGRKPTRKPSFALP